MTEPTKDFINLNGSQLFLDPIDRRAKAMLTSDAQLHPASTDLWRHAVRAAEWDWVVDIGANYGEMLLAVDLPVGARVVAIEPNPRVRGLLTQTLRRAVPQADVLPYAISDKVGIATMHEDVTWSGNSTLDGNWVEDRPTHEWQQIDVPAVTLAVLFKEMGVAHGDSLLIKLDIEGYEARILRDSHDLLRAAPRCALMVEVVRMSGPDLDWLLTEFTVYCLDTQLGSLVEAVDLSASGFAASIKRDNLYQRDVLAVPRRG